LFYLILSKLGSDKTKKTRKGRSPAGILLKGSPHRITECNPPPTSTPLKPLDFQRGFFVVGQLSGHLGQVLNSNYLLFCFFKASNSNNLLIIVLKELFFFF
jgi:hypothetical protein